MSEQTVKRIIILPFISNSSSPKILELENLIIQGLEYKLFPLGSVNFTDLKIKFKNLSIKPENDTYNLCDLIELAEKNNAKFALVGKFNNKDDNLITKLFFTLYCLDDLDTIETWESPDGCIVIMNENEYSIKPGIFNAFLVECTHKIINKLNLELDITNKIFIEDSLFNSFESYTKLVYSKKVAKTVEDKLKYLEESIEIDPGMDISYFEKARILRNKRDYNEAILNYQIGTDKTKHDVLKAIYYNEIGSCYTLIKDYDMAIKSWQNAIEYYPAYTSPYMNIALALEETGDYKNAEKYFLDIQQLAPSDCRTYFNLARLYCKTGQWLKAIDQYNNQLKSNPYDAWSHSNIGNCYLQLNKTKEAKEFFHKTISLDSDGEAGSYANYVIQALDEASKRDWWKFWRK